MKTKLSLFVALVFVVFSFVCCKDPVRDEGSGNAVTPKPSPAPTPNPSNDNTIVSFQSFNPRSISVKNNTGKRLVAFKGTIELSSLISGVPANAGNHGLRMDRELFAETGDFALHFITEEDFKANKDNLSKISNSPFASLYAFYNKNGSNDLVYTVSSKSGGDIKFTLHNNSPFNVEIRCNSPQGEVLGYVGAYTVSSVLNIAPGDYTLYPIFKKYIPRDNEIYSVVPRFTKSKKPFSRDFVINEVPKKWNLEEVWDPTKLKLSAGGFYLTVNNQSHTAVRFTNGDVEFETSVGFKGISSGESKMFFIPFIKIDDVNGYPDRVRMSTLAIGSPRAPVLIPEFEYELDKRYTITVTGDQADDLKLSALQDNGKVDINALFDL